jgi:hypothetical protein
MSSARSRLSATEAGGSLGGLNAALWLRDAGCDVDVFERTATSMDDRGAGIVLGSILYEEQKPYRFTSYGTLYRGMLQSFDERRYHRGEELVGFDHSSFGLTTMPSETFSGSIHDRKARAHAQISIDSPRCPKTEDCMVAK